MAKIHKEKENNQEFEKNLKTVLILDPKNEEALYLLIIKKICQIIIKVILFNHGSKNFIINNNDRVAQMILTPVIKMDLEETNELPGSIRGEGGFGSTGK